MSTGISSWQDWIDYILIVLALFVPAIAVPKYTHDRRNGRLEIERKLQRILTLLELHLQKNNNAIPKFFRSPFPYWTDIANGYVLRRMDLVTKLGNSLEESGLVLVLGHSGAGKTYLSYSSGYWGLTEKEEKYRYVYYDNVARASKLCSADATSYDLTESIRVCATDIADAMEKHEEFKKDKVLIILDDVHLRKDSMRSLGNVYNELPQSVKNRIHILLLGRIHTVSIADAFEEWAYLLYEQRTSQLLASFELNRQHYKEAALELVQTFFDKTEPAIDCDLATQNILVENADQSLRIVSLLLEFCQDIVIEGVLNHTNIDSINICDAIEKYLKNLCDDFETWRKEAQIKPISSFHSKMKFLFFSLATFNQMEIALTKKSLYASLSFPNSEVDLFLDFLISSGELLGHSEKITIPHFSLASHIIKCSHINNPNQSYNTSSGKNELESLCIQLLKIDNNPAILIRIMEFGLKIPIKWTDLVQYIKTEALDLLIQLMDYLGVRIVHYLEIFGDIFESNYVKEKIINRLLDFKSYSYMVDSLGIIRHLQRDDDVLNAIAKRIESIDNIIRVLQDLLRFDYMLQNKHIVTAIDSRIDEVTDFLKTRKKPWNAFPLVDNSIFFEKWPILFDTILNHEELFASIINNRNYEEMDDFERFNFFASLTDIPCLLSTESVSNSIVNILKSDDYFSITSDNNSKPNRFNLLSRILDSSAILRQDCIANKIMGALANIVQNSQNYREVIRIMGSFYFYEDIKNEFEFRLDEIGNWISQLSQTELDIDLILGLTKFVGYTTIRNILESRMNEIVISFDNHPKMFFEFSFLPNNFLLQQEPIKNLLNLKLTELLALTQSDESWTYFRCIGEIIDIISDSTFLEKVADLILKPHNHLVIHLQYLSSSSKFISNTKVKKLVTELIPEIIQKLRFGAYPWQWIYSIAKYPYLIESKKIKQAFLDRFDDVLTHISTESNPLRTIQNLSQIDFVREIKSFNEVIINRLDDFIRLIQLEGDGDFLLDYILALTKYADNRKLDEAVANRLNFVKNLIELKMVAKDEMKLLLQYPSVKSNPRMLEVIEEAMNEPD